MANTKGPTDRSVHIGGSVTGAVIQTGDGNTAHVHYAPITLPPAEQVDVRAELEALAAILRALETADRAKIDRALDDAVDEAKRPAPEKEEVGGPLERALKYAKGAASFAEVVEKLKPHVINLAGWLGEAGHKLLAYVGLSLGGG